MVDAIKRPARRSFSAGGFFDIVRLPGGRLKFPQTIRVAHPVPKTRSPIPAGQILVNPRKSDLWNYPEWLDFGFSDGCIHSPGLAPQASGLNSRYLKADQGI
jgi:hypothetical protein